MEKWPSDRVLTGSIFIALLFLTPPAPIVAQRSPQERIESLLASARSAIEEREWEKAESDARQVLGIALDQLGAIHLALIDYPVAEKAYQEACRSSVQSIRPFLGLGIVYLRRGKYEEGKELLTHILEINPTNAEALQILGKIQFMEGDFKAAARSLREAYSSSPDDTSIAYTLALAYLEQKNLEEGQKIFREIEAKVGESPSLHLLLGRAYRETEYWQEAVARFQRAAELDPDLPRVHYYLGLTNLLWEGAAAFESASQQFKLELERNPDELYSNFYLGVLSVLNQRESEGVPFLKKAVELAPENPDPYLYLGQALVRLGKSEEGIELLKLSAEKTENPARNNYQLSNTYYLLGQTLRKLGKNDEAVDYLRKSQELKRLQNTQVQQRFEQRGENADGSAPAGMGPTDLQELARGGEAAVILDESPPSQQQRDLLTNTMVFYRSAAASAYEIWARIKVSVGSLEAAAESLGHAVSWDSSSSDLLYNLAIARFRAKQFNEAAEPLIELCRRDPSRSDALQMLAKLTLGLVQSRQAQSAIEAIDCLLGRNPDLAELYVLRGQAYAQKGNYDLSLQDFQTALDKNPALPEVHYYAGMSLIRQGRLSQAIDEFDRELERNPNHARALYHKGFVLITQNRVDEAIPLMERVLEQEPRYADAYYQLGKAQLEKGQLIQAVANLETAASLDSARSHVFYQLSRAYARLGRRAEAEEALERYRQLKKQEDGAPAS